MVHDVEHPAAGAPGPADAEALREAALLARGVCRALGQLGFVTLTEFGLASGRRADIIALGRGGELAIVEVKTSLADFRADRKWPEYWEFCDRLYFAVAASFPRDLVPDPVGAAILREPVARTLGAARRRAVTLRFALAAAQRLRRLVDPGAGEGGLL